MNTAQDAWSNQAYTDPNNSELMSIGPSIDGELIPTHTALALEDPASNASQFYRSLDVLAGVVSGEGSLSLSQLKLSTEQAGYEFANGVPRDVFTTVLAPYITQQYFNNNSLVEKAIIDNYSSDDPVEQGNLCTDLFGDTLFNLDMQKSSNIHAFMNTESKTFQYLFDEPSPLPLSSSPDWFDGAAHADDVSFLFGIHKAILFGAKRHHLRLSEKMMTYWTNFARTG